MLEDLADWQVSQHPHGQDHPEDDFVGQYTGSLIDSTSDAKGLENGLAWDKLFESRQSVTHPACFVSRQRTSSLMHASRSLLVTSVLNVRIR